MNFPEFLQPQLAISGLGGPLAPLGKNPLKVDLQKQSNDFWCWAAVTSAVEYFYREPYAADQRDVAMNCLGDPPPDWDFDVVNALGNNAGDSTIGQIDFTDFQVEIEHERPVCFIVENGPSNHVILGTGYTATDVWLNDPAFPGAHTKPWSEFQAGYGGRVWKRTVKTKSS